MTIRPPQDKTLTKDTARKKIEVEQVILEYESYIDLRLRMLTNEEAKPRYEIKIDRETPGIGSYYSYLTQEDFELIKAANRDQLYSIRVGRRLLQEV